MAFIRVVEEDFRHAHRRKPPPAPRNLATGRLDSEAVKFIVN